MVLKVHNTFYCESQYSTGQTLLALNYWNIILQLLLWSHGALDLQFGYTSDFARIHGILLHGLFESIKV